MSDDISEELIRIIKSYSNNNDLVHSIYYLSNAEVLNKKEQKVCDDILESIELLNIFDLEKIIKSIDENIDINDFGEGYEFNEVVNEINKLIFARKKLLANNMKQAAYKNIINNNYDRQTVDFVYNRYPEEIVTIEDTTLDELEEIIENTKKLLTKYYCIDRYLKGLKDGTITTILGDNSYQKNILCLNIVYNIINEGKNVLYISIGASKKDLYKRFLIRHSCSKNSFQKLELDTSYNVSNIEYAKVYHDFKDNLSCNMIAVDESDYFISTHYSLLKTLCAYDNQFKCNTQHGIDVIVVDELSKMKLFNGKKYISNRNTIASEFYSFLKNQSNNLLSSGRKIPLVITYEFNKNNPFSENGDVPDAVNTFSDNIIKVISDDTDKSLSNLTIKVLKSINSNVMNISEDIHCDYGHWYVYDSLIEYGENSKGKLNEVQEENEKLQLENQANIANNNIMINKLNRMEETINSIKQNIDSTKNETDVLNLDEQINGNIPEDILAEFDFSS